MYKPPFVIKARMQLQRDLDAYPFAHSAFMLNQSLESLDVRMWGHCENSQKVAEYLETHTDLINEVRYPGLESSRYYETAQKHLKGFSGVVTIDVKGGREAGTKFMDALKTYHQAGTRRRCPLVCPAPSLHHPPPGAKSATNSSRHHHWFGTSVHRIGQRR